MLYTMSYYPAWKTKLDCTFENANILPLFAWSRSPNNQIHIFFIYTDLCQEGAPNLRSHVFISLNMCTLCRSVLSVLE